MAKATVDVKLYVVRRRAKTGLYVLAVDARKTPRNYLLDRLSMKHINARMAGYRETSEEAVAAYVAAREKAVANIEAMLADANDELADANLLAASLRDEAAQ